MLTSATLASEFPTLIKPRDWPSCFKRSDALKTFLNKVIKGRKVRLTSSVPLDIAHQAAHIELSSSDALTARAVHAALGWDVMCGFAIFEVEEQPGVFVAQERTWNVHPRNIWVNLSVNSQDAGADVVLVEADIDAARSRAHAAAANIVEVPSSLKHSKQLQNSPASGQPISDKPVSAVQPIATKSPASTADDPPSAELAPITEAPMATSAASPCMSFDDALASISLGPKAMANGGRFPTSRPKGEYAEEDPEMEFVARPGSRTILVGEGADQTKRKVEWPGKCAKTRLRVNRADNTFDLEARCWSIKSWSGDDPDRDLMAEVYGGEVEWFAPPDFGDERAAVLMISGRLHVGDHEVVRMKVETVDEQCNGACKPPITANDIYSVCGKSLNSLIDCSWRGLGHNMSLNLDRQTDWTVWFDKDHSR